MLPATAFAQTWSAVADTITPRNTPAAVASGGLLYALGGNAGGSTTESYDPATNVWSAKASAGPLAAEINGVLWAASLNTSTSQTTVQRYNAASNSWTTVSVSPVGFGGSQLVALGSELFFVTRYGRPSQSSPFTIGLHVYDTIANTWTVEVGQFQGPEERQSSTAVAANGKLYVLGGAPYAMSFSSPRVLEYNPATAQWVEKPAMPVGIRDAGATALNGKVYVIGGRIGAGSGSVGKATQVYDPASNSWSQLPDMPTARFGLGVAALGGNIYAVGGWDGTTAFRKVEKLTLAAPAAFYRIKNRWLGTYMHVENLTGSVQVGSIQPSWQSAHWALEDAGQGRVRLRNRWNNQYMHTENLTGNVQYGSIFPQWDSAKWTVETFGQYKRIRNVWTSKFVHIENNTGFAQYGNILDTWESAQWTLEPVL
jgi:N-acetylneuraminic acid mutarotase